MKEHEKSGARPIPEPAKSEIVISAVGDVMMPGSIQAVAAKNKRSYGFLFEKIASDLSAADITFANLETPVDHKTGVSGYPKFNARPELLASLKGAGVDIVSVANNHAMDTGVKGLVRTLDNLEKAGIVFTGAGRTKKEASEIKYITARGITVAFLAYTYSTNERLPIKKASAPGINILRPETQKDLAIAKESVRKARRSADLVVVSLHWGDEYATAPSAWQKKAAKELIDSGADVILGHHPHVLQPIESIFGKDGRRGIAAYSLGNFISSQNYRVSYKNRNNARALRGDGVILNIFTEKAKEKTSLTRVEFLPLWTLKEKIASSTVYRPVSLEREIVRMEAVDKRSKEEENILRLLVYRKKIITDTLSVKPVEQ